MARVAQLGIALGALGAVLMLMGLFPGVTGLEPTIGIGIVQLFVMLVGFSLLIIGALLYVEYTFYSTKPTNLAQQIGTRLAFTGIVLAAMASLADLLGFGSNLRNADSDMLTGPLQAIAIVGSFLISSIGVLIYAIMGEPEMVDTDEDE
jgi:hypothetical protein